MNLTAYQLARNLAGYAGVTSLNPNSTSNTNVQSVGYPPNLMGYILTAVNAALQEIHSKAPRAQYYKRIGKILNAPTVVTISVTQNSDICSVTGWQQWMKGCTIRISGNAVVNELISPCRLRRPYDGATASNVQATVYHDCIVQKSDVVGICEPVELPQIRQIKMCSTRQQFNEYEWNQIMVDDYKRGLSKIGISAKVPAQPRACLVDTEATNTGMEIRLQFLPLPDEKYLVNYGVEQNAFQIEAENVVTYDTNGSMVIGSDGEPEDPGTTFNTPFGWDESVLMPLATNWFLATPICGNGNPLAAQKIAEQCVIARQIIKTFAPDREATEIRPTFF